MESMDSSAGSIISSLRTQVSALGASVPVCEMGIIALPCLAGGWREDKYIKKV